MVSKRYSVEARLNLLNLDFEFLTRKIQYVTMPDI